jgi:hypothetical protein
MSCGNVIKGSHTKATQTASDARMTHEATSPTTEQCVRFTPEWMPSVKRIIEVPFQTSKQNLQHMICGGEPLMRAIEQMHQRSAKELMAAALYVTEIETD